MTAGPVRAVYIAAARALRPRSRAGVFLALVLAFATIAALGASAFAARRAATLLVAWALLLPGVGLQLLWALFCMNLHRQNDPALARTVPGHLRALRRAVLLGGAGLGGVGAAAGVAGAAVVGGGLALPSVGWALGLAIAAMWAAAPRRPVLAVLILPGLAPSTLVLAYAANGTWIVDQPLVLLLAASALYAAFVPFVVSAGGAGHRAAHARWVALTGGTRRVQAPPRGFRAYTAWWRERAIRRAGRPASRLHFGLGPQLGLHQVGLTVATTLVVTQILGPLASVWPDAILTPTLLGFAAAPTVVSLTLGPALEATAREQVLLRLLPGAPTGAAQGRWLAVHLAKIVLAGWLGAGVVLWAAPGLWGQRGPYVGPFFAAWLPLAPWAVAGTWRDWSRRTSGALGEARALGWLAGPAVAAAVWVAAVGRPWWELALLSTALVVPVLVWRWRALGAAPAPMPVGRFGGT